MSAKVGNYAIGVDLGGTNIRGAVLTPQGEIIAQHRIATPQEEGQMASPPILVDAILACIQPLLQAHPVLGVGIGSGGQFNPETGVMLGINTGHPAFVNQPFAQMLQSRLQIPVYVDNDVKAAAFAELKCGAGNGYQHIICVAVGTFIGGAVIVNGRIINGMNGLAGHLGHMMDYQTGTYIEDIAGGQPLGKRAIQAGLLQPNQTTEDLFVQARTGHAESQQFIYHAAHALGIALAGLCHVLQPEVILMGGTVGLQPEYIDGINIALQERLLASWQSIRAIPMQLGTNAGQIGAGLRVFDEVSLR